MIRTKDKQSITAGDSSTNIQIGGNLNLFHAGYPTELVDEKIINEMFRIIPTLEKRGMVSNFTKRLTC